MITIYPACFYIEADGAVSVMFPDLNHLATQGDNLQDAMEMAVECLAAYIEGETEDGNKIPEPSDIKDIDPIEYYRSEFNEDPSGKCFVSYVSVDVEEYSKLHFNKSVKKTLTIPAWLNKKALKANINFSKVLKEALIEKLS